MTPEEKDEKYLDDVATSVMLVFLKGQIRCGTCSSDFSCAQYAQKSYEMANAMAYAKKAATGGA